MNRSKLLRIESAQAKSSFKKTQIVKSFLADEADRGGEMAV
jgi:hypothetical protein